MELYLDTANTEEIRQIAEWGVLSGVTTNPSLVAQNHQGQSNRSFEEVIKEITSIVKGPVSAEVTALKKDEMINEGRRLSKISEHVVVKLPITLDGLAACRTLSDEGIAVNMTLCFSLSQAILVAQAGAAYVSPFLGRIDDVGWDGMQLVREIAEFLALHGLDTKIIAASIRHPLHVNQAALAGADIATMPFKVFKQLIEHPLTDIGLKRFLDDWEKFKTKL